MLTCRFRGGDVRAGMRKWACGVEGESLLSSLMRGGLSSAHLIEQAFKTAAPQTPKNNLGYPQLKQALPSPSMPTKPLTVLYPLAVLLLAFSLALSRGVQTEVSSASNAAASVLSRLTNTISSSTMVSVSTPGSAGLCRSANKSRCDANVCGSIIAHSCVPALIRRPIVCLCAGGV